MLIRSSYPKTIIRMLHWHSITWPTTSSYSLKNLRTSYTYTLQSFIGLGKQNSKKQPTHSAHTDRYWCEVLRSTPQKTGLLVLYIHTDIHVCVIKHVNMGIECLHMVFISGKSKTVRRERRKIFASQEFGGMTCEKGTSWWVK